MLFLLGLALQTHAQEGAVASGGDGSGAGGSFSYSVGQVVYNTSSATDGSSAQGLQQPIEVSEVLKTDDFAVPGITVYPNPVTSWVTVDVKDHTAGNLSFQLFDLNGRLIDQKSINSNETRINMEYLPATTYLLKIRSTDKEIKTYKLIKKE